MQSDDQDEASVGRDSNTTALSPNSGTSSIPLNGQPAQGVTESSQQQLRVLGDTNNQQSTPQLPGPSQFDEYEQYADSESALYIDILEGQGNPAQTGDTLAVGYIGYLSDGTIFDQSRPNEDGLIEPFALTLGAGQVIAGWEQGLAGMREGGRRRLIIPASVGYGSQGQGTIPPNALLIFDVELAAVQKAPQNQSGL